MKDYFIMSEEREKSLWKEALFIFDTNAICAMYRMTKDTQKTMLEILDYLKERIWIPAHVLYEYKKNRIEVIKEPIGKYYCNPDFFSNNYKQQLKQFIDKIEEQEYYHPYFGETELNALKKSMKEVSKSIDDIQEAIKNEFKKRKGEILAQEKSDIILDRVLALPLGEEFSYCQKIDIMKEGKWRYEQELPPGYLDSSEKHGIQKYGDLIIWKEILQKAKSNNCSVIFITNDVKQDWYEEHEKRQSPNCPRHELILEFKECTGKDVWLYTLDQFVEKLEIIFKDNTSLPFYKGLEAVKEVLARTKRQKELEDKIKKAKLIRVRCNHCGHHFSVNQKDFDFDWEVTGYSEREMGEEKEWECTETIICPECGEECSITFHIWEYPIGSYNYDEIETDGCDIEKKDIDLSELISFFFDEDIGFDDIEYYEEN
jgi:hypothetical protein